MNYFGKVLGKLFSRWRLLGGCFEKLCTQRLSRNTIYIMFCCGNLHYQTYLSVTICFGCHQTWLSLLEVFRAFEFPYAWKCLHVFCLNVASQDVLHETCKPFLHWLTIKWKISFPSLCLCCVLFYHSLFLYSSIGFCKLNFNKLNY